MKDIVIISNYIHFKNEIGNSRFIYLADKLKETEKVEIITSTFYHRTKKQRTFKEKEIQEGYSVKLIYEPGYKKNISLKRIYSNYVIATNIVKYLKKRKRPDVIYCAVPPTIIGKKVAKFAKKNNIRFIIDIQDLWPEAYKMVFNIPIISDMLFYPIKRQAEYTYKNADEIIAVSETYLNRAKTVNRNVTQGLAVYLGTDLEEFDKYKEKKIDKAKEIQIVYIGTLGHSYDIKIIIDAISILNKKGINNIQFVLMGDGPLKGEFEKYAIQKRINCIFTGMLEYSKMIEKLTSCDIAVNPIKKLAAQSIINKVGDYAMAGLPVINTQENEEYRNLVEKYNIGYNCKNGDANDVAEKIEILYNDKKLREEYGRNNRKLAKDKFDRTKTYKDIISIIEGNDE